MIDALGFKKLFPKFPVLLIHHKIGQCIGNAVFIVLNLTNIKK